MDLDNQLETLMATASVESGHAYESAAKADSDPVNRNAHLAMAQEAAGKALTAAREAEQILTSARNKAHGERAAARKASTLTIAHEQAIDHVEQVSRWIVQMTRVFAKNAESFAKAGLASHDRRSWLATIHQIERVEIPEARSVSEANALRADVQWLRRHPP